LVHKTGANNLSFDDLLFGVEVHQKEGLQCQMI